MLDENGNRMMQVFYCPECEKDKGYKSKGTVIKIETLFAITATVGILDFM